MIPMVTGPFNGAAVMAGAAETYVALGVVAEIPSPWIFAAAALVVLLVVVPVRLLHRTTTPQPLDDVEAQP